jgi:uncharacterized protein (UPF0548 family)
MFLLLRPSCDAIERFIRASEAKPLACSPIGVTRHETAGRNVDEAVVVVGRGAADFERARSALAAWKQFDIGWVEVFPRAASVEAGTIVAVLIRHVGIWSLNGCRVVYTVGDRLRGNHFGLAYGTLTNHAEGGEELFEVFLNPDSGDVTYRIRAVSWPRAALSRIGYPITRWLQAQFRRDSAEAMRRATSASGVGYPRCDP